MECSACGADNESGFNFCRNCGVPLARICPTCGTSNGAGFNFCANCGTTLREESDMPPPTPTPSTDSGERRFVSVLFADLVGFTPLAESRDPEEVRAMLTRYFERARQIIEGFGGEVDKFIGDAVTAFWGARVALEDDAERAVRAALELVDAVASLGEEIGVPDLELRAGVLSGETSVGSGGNTTGLVIGDIVNTASRLQSIARPGTVYVGESTRALADAAIRFELVGPHDLKGKSEPVTVWRASAIVAARGGRGRTETLEAPFVGREHELRLLKDQLEATGRERRARVVSIVGEGGIGKSRLAWELQKYVDGLTETFYWHQGRSPAYGDGVTLWSLGEMVRQRARIAETDDALKSRTKLQTVVAEFFPDPDDHRWVVPRLAGLLGLSEMPEGDRADLFGAIRTLFQRISERGTAVLVFEDVHWADEGLLDFIGELVERSPRHPILVVTLARPSLIDRAPGWGAARRGFTSAHLGPLSDVDMRALVEGTAPGIEAGAVDLVVGAAAGFPLYAIEYVRMLVAGGDLVRDGDRYRQVGTVESLALPDSLQAMVGARLDRLPSIERSVIQDAAVLGQSFTFEGLAESSGRSEADLRPVLDRLVRDEVLRLEEDPRSPERGQYQFVQSMIREVAYGRLSKADRRQRHLDVARQFEYRDAAEFAAIVASHYLSAIEAGAGSEVAAEARRALLGAARRAADLHSHKQTLTLIEQALEIPGEDRDTMHLLEIGAGAASSLMAHDVALSMATKSSEWAQAHGDSADRARAATALGRALIEAERPTDAAATMEPHLASEPGPGPERLRLGAELARANLLSLAAQRAAEVARDTLIAAEAARNAEIVVDAMNTRGTALRYVGRAHEAIALLREAVRLAADLGSPTAESRALNNYIVMNAMNGLQANQDLLERFDAVAERTGSLNNIVRSAGRLGDWLAANGEFEAAQEVFARVDLDPNGRWGRFLRAESLAAEWSLSADPECLDEALHLLEGAYGSGEPQLEAYTAGLQAKMAFLAGRPKQALEKALEAPVQSRLPFSDAWVIPILAAIRLGDQAMLEASWDPSQVPIGKRFEVFDTMFHAALAGFEGRLEESAAQFLQAIDTMETVDGALPAMVLAAVFAESTTDRTVAVEAGRRAHEWFTSKGAAGYLQLFGDIWPLGQTAAG